MTDLAAIRARDQEAGALWFTGPGSFTARAAREVLNVRWLFWTYRDAFDQQAAVINAEY